MERMRPPATRVQPLSPLNCYFCDGIQKRKLGFPPRRGISAAEGLPAALRRRSSELEFQRGTEL